jgi:hypothetical protein
MDMTKEDIIKLAKKVGLCIDKELQPELIVFSYLVAAAEREACAKLCDEFLPLGNKCAYAIRARGNTWV